MRVGISCLTGVCAVIVAWVFVPARATAAPPAPAAKDIRTAQSPTNSLPYAWYVPKRYMKGRKMPLVMSFHGAMGKGTSEITQWVPLADEFGFIVVCPTSDLAGAHTKPATPMAVRPEDFRKESEAWISVLDEMKKQYTVDERLVMVTGFSGGGNPAYWLAFAYPARFPFLCSRSGNFPSILKRLFDMDKTLEETARSAARSSFLCLYYGEKDHPIILREAPDAIAWIQKLAPAHFEYEQVKGMGHESRARTAAQWFSKKWSAALLAPTR